MDKELRAKFNHDFNEEQYWQYIREIESLEPGALDFRNAETPIFVPEAFTARMLAACEDITDFIVSPDFRKITERSIPENLKVPNENAHTHFIAFDFGICENSHGELEPQLIEMQGFPSLFAYQVYHSEITSEYAKIPGSYSSYLNGYNSQTHNKLLKEIIIGNENPDNVILLEIFPEKQKTRIDFYCTEKLTGIKTVCLTRLKSEGKRLYYLDDKGSEITIKRIYNRVIFDDLAQQDGLNDIIDLQKEYDVTWVPHPNWFYRISKFTLPFIDNPFVPETFFLNEVSRPLPLDQYVLKPLFSFAGMGVVIDVSQDDIDNIKDPENWILQKKVNYAPVILTPDEPAKAEIRIFYFWKDEWKRPVAVHNLARLSKGKMIGTRYNKDKTWVGGSIAYFQQKEL